MMCVRYACVQNLLNIYYFPSVNEVFLVTRHIISSSLMHMRAGKTQLVCETKINVGWPCGVDYDELNTMLAVLFPGD